jgi:RNA polymerase sigma-70 factor (ECF subfamily)
MAVYAFDMLIADKCGANIGSLIERVLAGIVRVAAQAVQVRSQQAADEKLESHQLELEDVRRSRNGDSDAYRRLIERHQDHVGHIMWRFSRDTRVHEELVQDVFVEAYLSLRTYRAMAPFANWLARIATRVGYRYWKQRERLHETETFSLEQWDQAVDSTQQASDAFGAGELLHKLLAQLPPRDRLVLTLRYLDQCSVEETAGRTGWTKAMVKVQTLRARKKLKKLFEQNWSDQDV